MPELRKALRMLWVISGTVMLTVLALSFVLGPDEGARFLPECEWQAKYGRACAFCGMTTAFTHLARGQLGEARAANRAALPLYLMFSANSIGVLIYAAARITRLRAGR